MRTPHKIGARTAVSGYCLLVFLAPVAAWNAETIRPGPDDAPYVRFQPSDAAAVSTARDTIPIQSLLLWGGINADRAPFLEPVFVIDAPPSLPDATGEYRITGHSSGGATLFSLDFEMPVVADGDGSSSFLFLLPAQPGWAGSLASVTLDGPGGSATLDEDTSRPMAIVRDPETRRIQAILRNLSPSIETQTIADTAIARDPRLEVLFSRGIPGPGAWPIKPPRP